LHERCKQHKQRSIMPGRNEHPFQDRVCAC
jgi:hypothetical protein